MADPGAELGGQGDAFNPLLLLPIAFLTILWFSPNSQTFLLHPPSYLPPLLPTILLALDFTSLSA